MLSYALIFVLLALVSFMLAWHVADPALRLPLAVYCGAYGLTTVAGATMAGVSGIGLLDELGYSLDTAILPDLGSFKYWLVLYAPLFAVPWSALFFNRLWRRAPSPAPEQTLRPEAVLLVFLVFSAYCFWRITAGGYGVALGSWFDSRGDYMAMILLRSEIMAGLGRVFFGLVYISLPALSFAALYQCMRLRTVGWQGVFVFTCAVNAILCLATMMKGQLLIYLLFLAVGLFEIGTIRPRTLLLLLAGVVASLTMLQTFFIEQWTIADSATLIVFRMASSFPYYLSLYPDVLPFGGIDVGLHLFGIGQPANDAVDMFAFMYPTIDWVAGAAPAPAHVRAYAEAGVPYSLLVTIVAGAVVAFAASLRRRVGGAISFAFYLESLVMLYYLTQTSLRESIISCYGFFWTVVALAALAVAAHFDRNVVARAASSRPAY